MIDYSVFKMEPLPPCVQTATKLLGNGEYIVFPRTRKNLMRKIDDFGFNKYRIGLILEAGAVIGGSFILRHLMQGAKWKPNNIDIIGTRNALNTAKRLLWKPDISNIAYKCRIVAPWISRKYNTKDAKDAKVIEYACWTNESGAILSFYCIKGNFVDDIHDCILQFDLPICRSFFDGRFIFVPNDTHEMLQKRRSPLTTKPVDDKILTIHIDYLPYMLEQADKYRSRGFEINLPNTICIGQGGQRWLKLTTNQVIAKFYSVSKKEMDRNEEDKCILWDIIHSMDWGIVNSIELNQTKIEQAYRMYPVYLRLKLIKK